ncbi:MAG: hypothetical protein BWY67_01644 [Bacteroidetes bacterium ADurb.Bin397]|nr:MAG: hypothetical protein BWY67_01644 [Bacteroidetes bacterium ADurb.Bin397]
MLLLLRLLQKLDCMLHFEVEIVFIGIGSEPDLFHHRFGCFCLSLFLFFLLFVKKFLIIDYPANGWISCWYNLYQIQSLLFSKASGYFDRIYIRFNVFSYEPDTGSGNIFIDIVLVFTLLVSVRSVIPVTSA